MEASAMYAEERVSASRSAVALRAATWNIHGAVGADRRYAPERIVAVLNEMNADIIALQEVASRETHGDFLANVKRATHYNVVAGYLQQRRGTDFGNAVLSRYPILGVERLDLAVHRYEPRGALDVTVDIGRALPFRVMAVHLGLRPGERREQVRRILAKVERDNPHPTLLLGDVNEWYLWGRPLRWLHSHFRHVPAAPATFPARRPVLALDRIWVTPAGSLRRLARHATPLARIASDHLPLTAEIVVR